MMRSRAIIVSIAAIAALLTVSATGYLSRIAPSGTGYKAMTACTALFVSGRPMEALEREEFAGLHPLLGLVTVAVDPERRAVSAHLLGMGSREAQYRKGLGCTLTEPGVPLQPAPEAMLMLIKPRDDEWEGSAKAASSDKVLQALTAAIDQAFAEPDPAYRRNTRALLVYWDGTLLAERYADGITADTPLPGYSLTKTVLSALIGIAWSEGRLDLDKPVNLSLWRDLPGDDPRRRITADHLLHMTTGTKWSEATGDPLSPVLRMTYHELDMAAFAARQASEAEPGTVFRYNSGSSLILSQLLLESLENDTTRYWLYPREKLFAPLGMTSAVIAPDAAGTLNGGFGASATARDWLRFGLLYLDGGMVDGEQVVPKSWMELSFRTQAASAQRGYGKHVWVNRQIANGGRPARPRPKLPDDSLLMNGQFGQLIAVIPSRRVVIVRLGQSNRWDFGKDPDELVVDILAALQEVPDDR